MRQAEISRATAETDIFLSIDLDGSGRGEIATGCGFLDHMLTLFARHGRFDMTVKCKGDTWVDYHHTVEDIGICLGKAIAKALGEKRGITRYGSMLLPMDETLMLCAIDISGRGMFCPDLHIAASKVGNFDTELTEEFFIAFTREAGITLHLRQLAGSNAHHIIEGAFKAFARALSQAVAIDPKYADEIPSTKGIIE